MSEFDLNLDNFVLGFNDFKGSVFSIYDVLYNQKNMKDSYGMKKLKLDDVIPERIYDFFRYNHAPRISKLSLIDFLNEKFSNKDDFLSLLQAQIKEFNDIFFYDYGKDNQPGDFVSKIIELISNPVFDLDFYFDQEDLLIKRKIDIITTNQINYIEKELSIDSNISIYNTCVSDFLSFDKDILKSDNNFYHESLDKMKDLIQNVLSKNYNNTKISEIEKVVNILFDNKNQEFKNTLDFIIKNIHHDKTGERLKINEKEYNYLWLELNKILYLLLRYKK